jgi:hypothetical protein
MWVCVLFKAAAGCCINTKPCPQCHTGPLTCLPACLCLIRASAAHIIPVMCSKPWQWAAHVLGHEGRGSVAALLKSQGLVQSLEVGIGDELRYGRGWMFFRIQARGLIFFESCDILSVIRCC